MLSSLRLNRGRQWNCRTDPRATTVPPANGQIRPARGRLVCAIQTIGESRRIWTRRGKNASVVIVADYRGAGVIAVTRSAPHINLHA